MVKEEGEVSMAARIGYGSVAVSDSDTLFEVAGCTGRESAGGRANKRDLRSRFEAGDALDAIVVEMMPGSGALRPCKPED